MNALLTAANEPPGALDGYLELRNEAEIRRDVLAIVSTSKREHFAAMAMHGLLASNAKEAHADYEWLANRAVVAADALLAELAKPVTP